MLYGSQMKNYSEMISLMDYANPIYLTVIRHCILINMAWVRGALFNIIYIIFWLIH